MDNKILCFGIENTNIYLEQVLVDYMEIPILLLCKGNGKYYISLCIDTDELRYIVVQLSLEDTYQLLNGELSIRECF